MMHGPCGTSNPTSPCMVDGLCSKQFPKEFVDKTFAGTDGYPHYRWRNDGKQVVKGDAQLDKIYCSIQSICDKEVQCPYKCRNL